MQEISNNTNFQTSNTQTTKIYGNNMMQTTNVTQLKNNVITVAVLVGYYLLYQAGRYHDKFIDKINYL